MTASDADQNSFRSAATQSLSAAPLSATRYVLLFFACACQFATILLTWPLWQVRDHPPNLSLIPLQGISFGWVLLATLFAVLIQPRVGLLLHGTALAAACMMDQFRMQPQVFGLIVLMLACVGDAGLRFSRWVIAAMWLWAGIHKFISPDWIGYSCWSLLGQAGIDSDRFYYPFALAAASAELLLGLLAFCRPGWGVWLCVSLHLGIIIFLSPLGAGINSSVIPWNAALMVVGSWILWRAQSFNRTYRWERVVRIAALLVPAGFYFGITDRSLAGVLYSGGVARGLISHQNDIERIKGWGQLNVPFPSERRSLRQYFEQTAQVGDKLHILDPRPFLSDQYFVLDPKRRARWLTDEEFYGVQTGHVPGVGLDRASSIFALSRSGVRMLKKTPESMIYAVEFAPQTYDRNLLTHLAGLPNLQQIQLAGTNVQDEDLKCLRSLRLLTGVGLDYTAVTDRGLDHLRDLPYLRHIEHEGAAISESAVQSVCRH